MKLSGIFFIIASLNLGYSTSLKSNHFGDGDFCPTDDDFNSCDDTYNTCQLRLCGKYKDTQNYEDCKQKACMPTLTECYADLYYWQEHNC